MENAFYNDFRAVSKAEQLKKINSYLFLISYAQELMQIPTPFLFFDILTK